MKAYEIAPASQRVEALTTETLDQQVEQEQRLEKLAQEVRILDRESRNNFAFGNLVTDAGQEFLNDTNAMDFLHAVQETANDPTRPTSLFHAIRILYKGDSKAIDEAITRVEANVKEQKTNYSGETANGPMLSFESNPGRINAKANSVDGYKRLAKINWSAMETTFGKDRLASLESFFSKLGTGDMALHNFEPGADWNRFAQHLTDAQNNIAEAYETLNQETVDKAGPLLEEAAKLEQTLKALQERLPQEVEKQKTLAVRTFLAEKGLINEQDPDEMIGSIIVNAPGGTVDGLGQLVAELNTQASKALATVQDQLKQLAYLKRSGPMQYYR